jgi:hypothetical protein
MANSNEPYRRLGTNSWQELLDQVNTVLQNPPEGCDPIATIAGPDPDHKWSKADITEVHDRLDTMPGDCFTFQPLPDKWKVSIITDIEGQLSNAWCDCAGDCIQQCSNARESASVTYLGSWFVDACRPCQPGECLQQPSIDLMTQARSEGLFAFFAVSDWSDATVTLCSRQDQLSTLEDELTALQLAADAICTIDPLPDPACAAAQAAVAAKQVEVDAKQVEVDAQQAVVDGHLADANAAAAASMQFAQDACTAESACGTCLVGSVGSEPCVDYACNQLGPDCLGKDPTRCCVSWAISRKTTRLTPFFSEGSWQSLMSGGYTPTGQPYIRSGNFAPCISAYACSAYGGADPCRFDCNGATFNYEARLTQVFPFAGGEECC